MPEDLGPQIALAKRYCELAGIPHIEIDGVEADDTMGSIAKWGESKGLTTYLYSSDKDLCQLVSDHVFLLRDDKVIDRDGVIALFGIPPEQMVDFLAITGDASDNIPGVSGCGPKTATTLLQTHHSLHAILAHPERLSTKRLIETFSAEKEVALLSQKLATIHTHVPVPHSLDAYALKQPDPALQDFFREMDFRSLVSKESTSKLLLVKVSSEMPMEAKAVEVSYQGKAYQPKTLPHGPMAGPHLKLAMHAFANEGLDLIPGFDTTLAAHLLGIRDPEDRDALDAELKKRHLDKLFYELEMPLLSVLFRMERKGILVDKTILKELSHDFHQDLSHLVKKIYALAGKECNLNSPKQLAALLFDHLGLPAKSSTSAEVLETIDHPIAPLILEYRSLEKLRSTYIDALPAQICPTTGRIHTTFNQTATATGRLSSTNPNLQNIPKDKKIRSAFKPARGHSFIAADYSQIELRLLAHFSEDPHLISAFAHNQDIHRATAAHIFDTTEVTDAMRFKAKAVNFGLMYGQQAFGLSKQLGIPKQEAAAFIETYFAQYPTVKRYLEGAKETARKTGRATTLLGRERLLPEIHSKNGMLRSQAERLAVNTPLQGTQADIIKLAMIELDDSLKIAPMILQIHDELIFECPDAHIDETCRHIRKTMESIVSLKVPLRVDISVGKNWGEC